MCHIEGIYSVSTNYHFVVSFASNFDDLHSNIDVVAVSAIHQIIVHIVLYTNIKLTLMLVCISLIKLGLVA